MPSRRKFLEDMSLTLGMLAFPKLSFSQGQSSGNSGAKIRIQIEEGWVLSLDGALKYSEPLLSKLDAKDTEELISEFKEDGGYAQDNLSYATFHIQPGKLEEVRPLLISKGLLPDTRDFEKSGLEVLADSLLSDSQFLVSRLGLQQLDDPPSFSNGVLAMKYRSDTLPLSNSLYDVYMAIKGERDGRRGIKPSQITYLKISDSKLPQTKVIKTLILGSSGEEWYISVYGPQDVDTYYRNRAFNGMSEGKHENSIPIEGIGNVQITNHYFIPERLRSIQDQIIGRKLWVPLYETSGGNYEPSDFEWGNQTAFRTVRKKLMDGIKNQGVIQFNTEWVPLAPGFLYNSSKR